MGFLDRAKKLLEQAKDKAEDVIADARAKSGADDESGYGAGAGGAPDPDSKFGTPYRPGMLGRPGWRERDLTDPAAVLPVAARDAAGVPSSTKSEIVEESYGMGRRWTAGERSAALFYQLYPEHQAWTPPGGEGALATLDDGRQLVFIGGGEYRVVLEVRGIDESNRAALARAVSTQLAG